MAKVTTTYKIVPVTSYEVIVIEEIEYDEEGATSYNEESFGIYKDERNAQTAVNALKKLDAAGIPNG